MLIVHYHLPGLFEFYGFYKLFLSVFFKHREFFYEWCDFGSIYGAPADCLWGGGRAGFGGAWKSLQITFICFNSSLYAHFNIVLHGFQGKRFQLTSEKCSFCLKVLLKT